jgi:ADP-ribose pyrophosphatase YjhB (NUDIX family)
MSPHSNFYNQQDSFHVAVDCIILGFKDNDIKLLVHNRELEPARGGLSLMGGFVKNGEALNNAAIRVLTSLTGLENIFMEQVGMYGEVDRDPGKRVISCVFYALIDVSSHDQTLLEKHNAFWINISRSNELIFDHAQMVKDALTILRRKAAIQPLGFNLLPDKFTMTHLQSLYEAIYSQTLDKRNFRKKMISLNFMEKLDEIDKSGSKKGAYYYRFRDNRSNLSDSEKYF